MVDHFNVSASIIWKYVDIVRDVFIDKDKLFNKYIDIPSRNWLKLIIQKLSELIGLPNICGSIDGTHIPLANLPSKKVTHAHNDFYEKKNSIVLFYNGCVVETSGFEMCVGQPRGVHDGGQLKVFNLYKQLKDQEIL